MNSVSYVYSSAPIGTARCVVSSSVADQIDRLVPVMTAMQQESLNPKWHGIDDLSEAVIINVNATTLTFSHGRATCILVPHAHSATVTALSLLAVIDNLQINKPIVAANAVSDDPDVFQLETL